MRYIIAADIHTTPQNIHHVIRIAKEQCADAIILNGDLGEPRQGPDETLRFTADILRPIGHSAIPTYVSPGSSETIAGFGAVLSRATRKYPSIFSALDRQRYPQKDHDLVFLPGSDICDTGEYQLVTDKETGYVRKGYQYNMNELRQNVTAPEQTLAVCHVPRRFDADPHTVDIAFYGIKRGKGICPGWAVKQDLEKKHNTTFSYEELVQRADAEMDILLKKENRGNTNLKELFENLGITKALSNHFHETGHRACDNTGTHVPQDTFMTTLFYNSGCLDNGQLGMIEITSTKIRYVNLTLD